MVSIDKRRIWANDETKVAEPPTTLQDTGYAPLEQPYNEHHNWIWNSRDKGVNKLIHERNFVQRFSHGLPIDYQVSGRIGPSHNVVHPYAVYNTMTLGSYGNPICICPAWDYANDMPCVYVGFDGYTSGILSIRNDAVNNLSITTIPLSFLEGTEYVESIVSEGAAFYVMTKGHSSGNVYFYRFSANPLSATPVWSTSDTGSKFKSLGRNAMCIADSSWLAYVRTNAATDGTAGNELVRLIRKSDAGAFRQGHGNVSGLASTHRTGWSIVSDGRTLYFAVYDAASIGWVQMAGADISDPTTATYVGDGGGPYTWFPERIEGTQAIGVGAGDLVFDGRLVHLCATNGMIGSLDSVYHIWELANAPIWKFDRVKATYDEQEHASMCFDGFYGYGLFEYDGQINQNNAFVGAVRLADGGIDDNSGNYPYILGPPHSSQIFIGPPKPGAPQNYMTKMIFSDNSLWVLPRIKDPAPSEPVNLMRITNAWARR